MNLSFGCVASSPRSTRPHSTELLINCAQPPVKASKRRQIGSLGVVRFSADESRSVSSSVWVGVFGAFDREHDEAGAVRRRESHDTTIMLANAVFDGRTALGPVA